MSMMNQRMAARRKYDPYTGRKVCCYSVSKETTALSPQVCEPKGESTRQPSRPPLPRKPSPLPPRATCPVSPAYITTSVTNLPHVDIAQRKGSACKL